MKNTRRFRVSIANSKRADRCTDFRAGEGWEKDEKGMTKDEKGMMKDDKDTMMKDKMKAEKKGQAGKTDDKMKMNEKKQ